MPRSNDVLIVGGGIVGCACAYYLASEGAKVEVIDRSGIAAEASGASGGFIDWASGLSRGTLEFVYKSIQLLRKAATEIEDFEIVLDGYIMLALDEAEFANLGQRHQRARNAGLESQLLEGADVRSFEPALAESVIGALYMPDSGHVDPTRMTESFAGAAKQLGAIFEIGVEVSAFEVQGHRVVGALTSRGKRVADHYVLSAGAWSTALAATAGIRLPVEPGKGQILATEPVPPITSRVLNSSGAGIRQNRRGEVIVGSTLEYVGFDKTVNPQAISDLLVEAARIFPALRDAKVRDSWAGLRPMTPDTMPIVAPAPGIDGLWLATGHSRTGLSYAAGTGRAIADLILHGETPLPIERFNPDRFGNSR